MIPHSVPDPFKVVTPLPTRGFDSGPSSQTVKRILHVSADSSTLTVECLRSNGLNGRSTHLMTLTTVLKLGMNSGLRQHSPSSSKKTEWFLRVESPTPENSWRVAGRQRTYGYWGWQLICHGFRNGFAFRLTPKINS